MSNGPILCCASGVCCPPDDPNNPGIVAEGGEPSKQVLALGALLAECGCPRGVSAEVAVALAKRVDVVPVGVGRAVVEGYRHLFEFHLAAKSDG